MDPLSDAPGASIGASTKLTTRAEAVALGLVRFFTGEPCPHGHTAERYVRDSFCCECKRIRRAAYTAERGAEENAKRAAYYLDHRDAELARKARYNRENRPKRCATAARRRAKQRMALPAWFGELDDLVMAEAAELAMRRRAATGIDWHVDHMIPLLAKKASGLHVAANVQVIPQRLNNWKKNRMQLTEPGEWIRMA